MKRNDACMITTLMSVAMTMVLTTVAAAKILTFQLSSTCRHSLNESKCSSCVSAKSNKIVNLPSQRKEKL